MQFSPFSIEAKIDMMIFTPRGVGLTRGRTVVAMLTEICRYDAWQCKIRWFEIDAYEIGCVTIVNWKRNDEFGVVIFN